MHFGGYQGLFLLKLLRQKNWLKLGKFWKFLKVTAKPMVAVKMKGAWKKSWEVMEFEEHKRVQIL